MIFFLYGPDSYRRRQKADYLVKKYKEKHLGLSLEIFDLENEEELPRLSSFCSSQSLFEPVKLALVNNFLSASTAATKKIILSIIETPATNLILFSDKKPPSSLNFLLQDPVRREEFPLLSGPRLLRFINEEAARRGLSLHQTTINHLSNSCLNSWEIINELDRLSLLKEPLSSPTHPRHDFFKLINLLTAPTLSRRLEALYFLKSDFSDPAKIFNLLAYQRSLDRSAAAAADRDVKSGRLDYPEAILSLILK